jgi:hypothetical protein
MRTHLILIGVGHLLQLDHGDSSRRFPPVPGPVKRRVFGQLVVLHRRFCALEGGRRRCPGQRASAVPGSGQGARSASEQSGTSICWGRSSWRMVGSCVRAPAIYTSTRAPSLHTSRHPLRRMVDPNAKLKSVPAPPALTTGLPRATRTLRTRTGAPVHPWRRPLPSGFGFKPEQQSALPPCSKSPRSAKRHLKNESCVCLGAS